MNITHFFTHLEQKVDDREILIPISSTLIQIEDKNFLIDTGFVNRLDIVYSLNKLGLSALDIHYVLNTHVHPDHCGGNRYFTNARIYISERDYFFQRDFMRAVADTPLDQLQAVIQQFYPLFNDKQTELFSPLAKEMAMVWEDDMVGNSEQIAYIEEEWPFDFIRAVPTPGHSIQHYCFRILTNDKDFLITGDALTTKTAFRLYKLDFPYCYDAKQYLQSQRRIGRFQGIIVPGHDKPFDSETAEYLENYDSDQGKTSDEDDDIIEQYLR